MTFKELNITTARISGLEKAPYYFNHRCYWAWDIMFLDSPTLGLHNITWYKVGDNTEEAIKFCKEIKKNFKKANIYEGDEVALIFEDIGRVIAIGRIGQDKWLDVRDKFKIKPFKDLNVVITKLKVY